MRSFSTFIVARASMKARKVSLWACFSMTPRARSLCQRSTRQLQQSRKHSRVYYRPRFGSDGKGKRPVALTKRSEEHTSELQSLMRISYADFCLKKKKNKNK